MIDHYCEMRLRQLIVLIADLEAELAIIARSFHAGVISKEEMLRRGDVLKNRYIKKLFNEGGFDLHIDGEGSITVHPLKTPN